MQAELRTDETGDPPVLVVGAGPVGTTLALALAGHGIRCTVIERSMRPSVHPKMDYINGRSMELLRRLGVADTVRERGVDDSLPTTFLFTLGLDQAPVTSWHIPPVAHLRDAYATADGPAPVEPYQRVAGSVLESTLLDAVRAHPLITLLSGWTLSDLQLDADGVTAMVVDPETKQRRALRASYLAACDGARSTVRRCLEIDLDQRGETSAHCSVFFTSRDPGLRRWGRAFVTLGARGVTLVSRDERNAWTASVPIPRGEPLTSDPIVLVQERLGYAFSLDAVHSVTQWEGSLSVATAYGRGRAFLVGDAAHQFFPAGGLGANTGIADAIDLAWKLAATLSGWGGPRLLASYDAERRPIGLLNRELSADLSDVFRRFGRLAECGVSAPVLAGLLAQEAHHVDNIGAHFGYRYSTSPVIPHETQAAPPWDWRHITETAWPGARAPYVRLPDGSSLFDHVGLGLTLVDLSGLGIGEPLVRKAQGRGIPMTLLAVSDERTRRCWGRDLVLIRPDDHVAWRGDNPPDDWEGLLDQVTGWATATPRLP